MKQRKLIVNVFSHALLAVLGFIWVLPIFYVILTAFRAESGSYKTYIFPKAYTLDNFIKLINTSDSMIDFKRWFLNTLIIAIFSTIIAAFFTICVAYCMSRLRFRMRKPFLNLAMILGMFPGFMSMIAVYYILKGLGFLETGLLKQVALVLVYSGGAGLGFYIAKGFLPEGFAVRQMRAEYKKQAFLGDVLMPRVLEREDSVWVALENPEGSPYVVAQFDGIR